MSKGGLPTKMDRQVKLTEYHQSTFRNKYHRSFLFLLLLAHPSPFELIFHLMKRHASAFSAGEASILDRPLPLRRLVPGAGRESIANSAVHSWSSPESDSRTDSPRRDKAVLAGRFSYPVWRCACTSMADPPMSLTPKSDDFKDWPQNGGRVGGRLMGSTDSVFVLSDNTS
jgi:hypothetical protein